MLAIGIVGLNGKYVEQYLSVFRSLPDIKWYICSNDTVILKREIELFSRVIPCDTLDELLAFPLDAAFVFEEPKNASRAVIRLLSQAIPVFMDIPATYHFDVVESLYRKSKETNTLLMAGFRQRFSPKIQLLKQVKDKTRITIEQNFIINNQPNKHVLYDSFLEAVDTALYLMDDLPLKGSYYYKKRQHVLEQCMIYMENKEQVATVTINLSTGTRRECVQVASSGGIYCLENGVDLVIYQGNSHVEERFSPEISPTYTLGIEQTIRAFLDAVVTKQNPISAHSTLLSYSICERIEHAKASEGFLSFAVEHEFR